MKKFIYRIICVFFLVFQSCSTDDEITIYVDPALSSTIDKENLKQYFRQNLAQYLTDDIFRVELKLLSNNTASKSNSKVIVYDPPEFDESIVTYEEKPTPIKIELYEKQVEQYKRTFINKLIDTLTTLEYNSKESGIAEMIVPLSNKIQHPLKTIVITDLVQMSSVINFKNEDFTKESDAITLAQKHALKIREHYIFPEKVMSGVELNCLIVSNEDEYSQYYLERYWTTYFRQFEVEINFQKL